MFSNGSYFNFPNDHEELCEKNKTNFGRMVFINYLLNFRNRNKLDISNTHLQIQMYKDIVIIKRYLMK